MTRRTTKSRPVDRVVNRAEEVDAALTRANIPRNGRTAEQMLGDAATRAKLVALIHRGGPDAAVIATWTTADVTGLIHGPAM